MSTRAVGQLAFFVMGRPQMDVRRLCGSPSALWAEEWSPFVVKPQRNTGVPVKSWSETFLCAAEM